ncbi:MAG: hypothetical protein KM310_00495 [Clostridiales bacterium]|nr:hypothetical protein [Clostridiales bacterium]
MDGKTRQFLLQVGFPSVYIDQFNTYEWVDGNAEEGFALLMPPASQDEIVFLLVAPLGAFAAVHRGVLWYSPKTPQNLDDALAFLRLDRESATHEEAFARWWITKTRLFYYDSGSVHDDGNASFFIPHWTYRQVMRHPHGATVFLGSSRYYRHETRSPLAVRVFAWYTRQDLKEYALLEADVHNDYPLNRTNFIPLRMTPKTVFLTDRRLAWPLVHPDRYKTLLDLQARRQLRRLGIHHNLWGSIELVDVRKEARVALIDISHGGRYVLTPRHMKAVSSDASRLEEAFRKAFGFPLPEDPTLQWEDVEALIALHAMGG